MLTFQNGYLVPSQMAKGAVFGSHPVPGLAEDAQELLKTLTAGSFQTDVAQLQGGEAVRIESLDRVIKAITIDNKDFRLWNNLMKHQALNPVDQWIDKTQASIAKFIGSAFIGETDAIPQNSADYARRTAFVKYMSTLREISVVQLTQRNVIDVEADENYNAGLELLQSTEWANFFGNSVVVPEEFDGLERTLEVNAPQNIRDLAGSSDVSALYAEITDLQATVRKFGNFGVLTDMYHGTFVQSDLDNLLLQAYRVSQNPNGTDVLLGAPVLGIRTSFGDIGMNPDVITGSRFDQEPMDATAGLASSTDPTPPASVTVGAASSDPDSKFKAEHAGTYYYRVASINKNGESTLVNGDTGQAIAAGESVQLSIVVSTNDDETGYAIYRSRKDVDPAADKTDLRLVRRIAKATSPTLWKDQNAYVPGSETIFLVNHNPGHDAIAQGILSNLMRWQLYPTNKLVHPFAYFMFTYLRVTKAVQHAIIKNYIPTKALWKPFG
jgi:hypothetical protein